MNEREKLMKSFDAIILGFGKGGKTLAGTLAAADMSVAVVERSEKMYGGTCINVGCIPSKSLITSAKSSAAAGGVFSERAARYAEAVRERSRVVSLLRQKNFDKLTTHPKITVLTGVAEFHDGRTVRIAFPDGSADTLTAPRIFINTGSRPFFPPIDGVQESSHIYSSETLMSLETLPRRLVVIGAGYIGMEFAAMYANFGAQVTVIQDGAVFLPREDAEIAQTVLDRLKAMGVRRLFSAKVVRITDRNGFADVLVETPEGDETLPAEVVLLATGRRPNAAELHPERAGVALTPRGAVQVDGHLRTTAPGIWAMGDVTGGLQFTYISLDDFRIVKSDVLGEGNRTSENRGAVPYSVFLDPPFSRVGLSEKEALELGYDVSVFKLAASAIPKAQVLRETSGLLKAVVDRKTGRILGAHLFCAESHEMINIIKLAMDASMPYTVLRDQIFTHPTMAEALNDLFTG